MAEYAPRNRQPTINAWKSKRPAKVDYWFADTISGKTCASQRPQFAALLAQIRNGETLAVSKLDRLGRDAQDVGATAKL
ncbi:recombinase family protein [Janthinobacterium sp. RA13]|uniref:recombinase family protein n=1 Tax=Janthinobacterium sp. RA13 TaxID=1502762 RepID=UPI0022853FF9|nr:recombinase family protein [Janthinobacterium sp. RA13]